MRPHRDPHSHLAAALLVLGGDRMIESEEKAWASATFSGSRHRFIIAFDGDDSSIPFRDLDEREFDLPGHIVADIALTDHVHDTIGCRLTIEALTVIDC